MRDSQSIETQEKLPKKSWQVYTSNKKTEKRKSPERKRTVKEL